MLVFGRRQSRLLSWTMTCLAVWTSGHVARPQIARGQDGPLQAGAGQEPVNRYRQPLQAILTANQSLLGDVRETGSPANLLDGQLLDRHGALLNKADTAQNDNLLAAPAAAGSTAESEMSALDSIGPAAGSSSSGGIPSGAAHGAETASRAGVPAGLDPHAEVFANDQYPSASKCAQCHKKIYDEWRVSAHAYAAVSPMFHKFEQKMTELTKGTVGTFCVRCHAPAAVQMGLPREASFVDAPLVSLAIE